jgi:poly-gamma-glutamate capsule biosynthesis protein CapA/YwtB (metallophosphatase superfamily)
MRRAFALGVIALLLATLQPASSNATGSSGNLRVAFVGDTHGFGIVEDPALDGVDLLGGARNVLSKADLFVFNHEGTLIEPEDEFENCREFDNQSTFATPPDFANRLAPGLPTVAALGNNHAMDCGPAGLQLTLLAFADAGIPTTGAGNNLQDACSPVVLNDIKATPIAVFSYLDEDPDALPDGVAATDSDPGVATLDGCDFHAAIKAYAGTHLVFVSLHSHWGSSWRYGVSSEHVSAAQDLFDAGADIVASSGPHYPQGVLVEGRQLAFMGLGDFMFNPGYTITHDGELSFMALAEIQRARVARAWLYPFALTDDGLPSPASLPTANSMLSNAAGLSKPFGVTITNLSGIGLVRPEGAPAISSRK